MINCLSCRCLTCNANAQEALKPVNSAARDVVAQLQRLLGQQPDLSFPITAAKAQTWLINTFLDEARLLFCGLR